MKDITFVDLEVTLNTCRVVDIGAVRSDRTPFHENSFDNLLLFLHQVPYIGGHNISLIPQHYSLTLFISA